MFSGLIDKGEHEYFVAFDKVEKQWNRFFFF